MQSSDHIYRHRDHRPSCFLRATNDGFFYAVNPTQKVFFFWDSTDRRLVVSDFGKLRAERGQPQWLPVHISVVPTINSHPLAGWKAITCAVPYVVYPRLGERPI